MIFSKSAAVWLLTKMDTTGQIVSLLSGSAQGILHGQVWRLVTYVFVPTEASPIWLLVMLYFYYWIGSCLEREWGNGKFTIYYVSGMLLTAIYGVVLSAILGRDVVVSTTYLNLSMFFAFATLYPDMQVLLFFIVSIAALIATRPLVRKMMGKNIVPTNADAVLGKEARVTETIDNAASAGAVYVDGKTWSARSISGEVLPEGTLVRAARMEGVKLFVERL